MLKRFFKKYKDEYFLAMLTQCVSRGKLTTDTYTAEEMTTLLFPKKERDMNVDTAFEGEVPLNLVAMRYYASSMKTRYEDDSLDDDQYCTSFLAQLDYLAASKHWDILEGIQRDLVPDKFKEYFAQKIAEEKLAA